MTGFPADVQNNLNSALFTRFLLLLVSEALVTPLPWLHVKGFTELYWVFYWSSTALRWGNICLILTKAQPGWETLLKPLHHAVTWCLLAAQLHIGRVSLNLWIAPNESQRRWTPLSVPHLCFNKRNEWKHWLSSHGYRCSCCPPLPSPFLPVGGLQQGEIVGVTCASVLVLPGRMRTEAQKGKPSTQI